MLVTRLTLQKLLYKLALVFYLYFHFSFVSTIHKMAASSFASYTRNVFKVNMSFLIIITATPAISL